MSNKKKEKNSKEQFVYCSQRYCPHLECLRHDKHIPFNTLIVRDKFKPDKDWNCKDIVIER